MASTRRATVVGLMSATVMSVGVLTAAASPAPTASTAESGNPFVDGWYADPDVAVYDNTYWVYPTSSRPYGEQTYLDAFSSPDLVNWTKHPNVLTTADVSWANRAVWAPAPVQRNGKYYLYFAANDIQNNSSLGGIGVAVAARPEGPYVDAIGRPLIGQFENGAQPIDQDVFIDDDGQAYMYYGGWGHANVVKLNNDMVSLGQFPDGSTYKEITPSGYTEGPQMLKRNGKYYLMWSEGYWGGPDYSVAYAMSSSPTGPFTQPATILAQDSAVATGSGHNSVLNVPGTDDWFIVYHRHPLGDTDGNHRQLSYDRMNFNADGTIQPVVMRTKDNFADGNAIGWKSYGGSWTATGGQYAASTSLGGKALLNNNFSDFTYDADVTLTAGSGDAGMVFRATGASTGTDAYKGYYVGLRRSGSVVLGRANNNWTELRTAAVPVSLGTRYHLRVEASGASLKIFVDDLTTPRISLSDSTYTSGATGVRVFNAAATFDNISVEKR